MAPFDRFELWVDPTSGDLPPDAVALGRSLNSVRWVGFVTGKRTEPTDVIVIDELALGESWDDVVPSLMGKPRVADSPSTPPPKSSTSTVGPLCSRPEWR